jgi:sugar porter (SP) family MFS transporter
MRNTSQANYSFVILITVTAAIAGLLFGFDTGVISGALGFIAQTFQLAVDNNIAREIIVSAVPVGALIGAVISGKSATILGRRRSIILSAFLFIVGTICAALAADLAMVIIGRLVMGFAVGLSAMTVPMYLSEVAPPKIRGMSVFVFQLAITIGIMLAFVINYIYSGEANWRMMFGVAIIPSAILLIGMWLLPASPRWLMMRGRKDEARKILEKLDSTKAKQNIQELEESLQHNVAGIRELFSKKMFPLVVVAFGLFVFQQFTGINTIFYYAPTVFKAAGFTGTQGAILASVATGVCNVLSTFVGIALVDRWGRRKLLFMGMAGMIICLAVIGFAYHGVFGLHIQTLTIIAVLAFIFFFATSIAGCAYLIMSELFPLRLRAAGMATASVANWGFNICVSATFLSLIAAIGIGNTFLLYAFCTFIGLIFIVKLVPETKGVTLEHLEHNLYAGKKLRELGDI